MYTNDQKIHAIEIVKKCKGIINKAWRLLGYPDSRDTLKLWYKNFQEDNNKITKTPRYSDKEIDKAVSYYLECKNIQKTIDDLGYPDSRMTLWRWIKSQDINISNKRGRVSSLDEETKGSPDIFSYHFVVVLDCHFNPLHYAYQYYPLNKYFILSSSYFLDGASGGVVLVKEILSSSTSTYLSHLK